MTGRTRATCGLLTFAIVSLLLLTGGCGTDRSAAPRSPVVTSDQDIWVRDLASSGAGPLAQGTTTPKGEASPADLASARAQTKVTIDGAVGGTVVNDRITVVFPPGAFAGKRIISLDVQNADGYIECHLFPEGLKFDVPVVLSMSLLGTTGDTRGTTIYWYDPTTSTWVDMQGAYVAQVHGVVARLQHFSDYRAGRSGW